MAAFRMTGPERRHQILSVTLDVISEHGLQGATNARIARAAGISEKMLYVHFASRKELLLSALDLVFDRASKILRSCDGADALERLREVSRAKWASLESQSDGYVGPLFEFFAGSRELGLREYIRAKLQGTLDEIEAIVDQGKAQRVIASDVDSDQVAWEFLSVMMSEDVYFLAGFGQSETTGRSNILLERVLRDIGLEIPASAELAAQTQEV